jgi:hypothetical protein
MSKHEHLPALPPPRRGIRPSPEAARRNDLMRRAVVGALRASRRYDVITNLQVPVPQAAREAVRLAHGRYIAASLPIDGACTQVTAELVVVDGSEAWAGAYVFCRDHAQSPRARRCVEEDLRSVELVLAAHVSGLLGTQINTVVAGIIDGTADPETSDDLTISLSEIAAHFEVPFGVPEDESLRPLQAGPAG